MVRRGGLTRKRDLPLMYSFFGMFPVAWMADKWGRRRTIMFGAIVYMYVRVMKSQMGAI